MVMVVAMAIFAVRRFASLLEPRIRGAERAVAPAHGMWGAAHRGLARGK